MLTCYQLIDSECKILLDEVVKQREYVKEKESRLNEHKEKLKYLELKYKLMYEARKNYYNNIGGIMKDK